MTLMSCLTGASILALRECTAEVSTFACVTLRGGFWCGKEKTDLVFEMTKQLYNMTYLVWEGED